MKRLCFVGLFFLSGLILFAQNTKKQDPDKSDLHESKNPIARVEKSKSFEKQMDCEEELEVRSLISGSISEVLVKPGDRVKLGQLLIRLDSSELEQEMKDLEDSLKKWKKIFYNREHWKVRSEAAEKQAKRKISEFQKEIMEKQNQISQKQIRSLIGGIVIDIVVEDKMVKEDMVVARIGNDAVLKIILSVGEELSLGEFERLQEGEKISLTFKKLNMACSGEVKKRDPYIIIRIPNEKLMLSPGMKAIFRIKTEIKPEPPAREEIKEAKQTQQKKLRTKKIDFEVSAGMSYSNPGDFYYRASGIDTLVDQYIKNYGLEYSVSGEFGKNIFYFPLNATMNYQVSSKLYLKGGLEFGYGTQSNEKTYTLNWGSFSEDSRYKLASTLMYFMPFLGAETRFGDFGIYANVCLNFMSLSHQKNIELSEPTYWYKKDDDISASGSGFGILLGGKYTFELGKKLNLLVKLEFCYLKIGKLTGTRDTAISNSAGESFFESIDGTIYSFEMNPYDIGWFNSWELYDSIPTDSWIRNINELTFNLSSIRLMVGFVF